MKVLFVAIILYANIAISQVGVAKQKNLTLDETKRKLEREKNINRFILKFDKNSKPVIEIKFLNDLSEKKTIAFVMFNCFYTLAQRHMITKIYSVRVKPGSDALIKSTFREEDLHDYRKPSDMKLDKIDIIDVRFLDGSRSKEHIFLKKFE